MLTLDVTACNCHVWWSFGVSFWYVGQNIPYQTFFGGNNFTSHQWWMISTTAIYWHIAIINWDVDLSMVYQQGSKHDGTMTSIGCDGGQCNQQPRNISQQKSHVEHNSPVWEILTSGSFLSRLFSSEKFFGWINSGLGCLQFCSTTLHQHQFSPSTVARQQA